MYDEEIIIDTPTLYNGVEWCHLAAKDVDKLHAFAKKIGLKREWFQVSNKGLPHYDIKSSSKRTLARRMGAAQVERKYLLQYLKFHYPTKITLSVYPYALQA